MATEQVYVLFISPKTNLLIVNHKPITIPIITNYQLSVTTGDVRGAGTDANVFAQIIGEFGSTAELKLTDSKTYKNKFERNHTDVFIFDKIQSMGKIKNLRVWHDNTGPGAGWHLYSCELYDERNKVVYTLVLNFRANRWLAKDEEDGKCEVMMNVDTVEDGTGLEDIKDCI